MVPVPFGPRCPEFKFSIMCNCSSLAGQFGNQNISLLCNRHPILFKTGF